MQSAEQNKERFWQGHILGWKRSSMGIREYCERQEISKDTFYYWRKRLGCRLPTIPKATFSAKASSFVPVQIDSSPLATRSESELPDAKWLGAFASALIRGLR
jgi:hypothetical protein